jgi:hypothetical protein
LAFLAASAIFLFYPHSTNSFLPTLLLRQIKIAERYFPYHQARDESKKLIRRCV